MTSLYERLIEERINSGMNKREMSVAGKVANSTYLNYEKGLRVPDADFLAAIARSKEQGGAGADIYYILVGRKENQPQPVVLSAEEVALMDTYRGLDKAGQEMIRLNMDSLMAMAVSKGRSKTVRKKQAE